MTFKVRILANAPSDSQEWSWAPWGNHSRLNPFSYLSTKKLEWIKVATHWTCVIGTLFIIFQICVRKNLRKSETKTLISVFIIEGGIYLTKLFHMSALSCRRILIEEQKWGEESKIFDEAPTDECGESI